MKNVCLVCESGWIICGKVDERNEKTISLIESSVVRTWSNGRGIGAIAKAKHKNEYTLDEIGAVDIYTRKVLFEIPCEW